MKTYPTNVSRTLDPVGKSLVTIVGLHDKQITDADINLIQDLQDSKRQRLLANQVTSGALTYSNFVFNPFVENQFQIPAFDVLFNGEVVTIAGFNSSNQGSNVVQLPAPVVWAPGDTGEPARIFVVFLEVWYQALNPVTGDGYYVDPQTGLKYFYPYGCVKPFPTNAKVMPDDSVDPFQGLFTTERAQIQWRLSVQRVALSYDFSKYRFGLDPGASTAETVYAQGKAANGGPIASSTYQFTNMGSINGDTALWRAGDGNPNNSLGSMDGYSYAMPIAICFQRNAGAFDLANNSFGCAQAGNAQSGLLIYRVSGRFDFALADQIFADQVVDTRSTVNLQGYDSDELVGTGFTSLITGNTRLAVTRGESPGRSPLALGSVQNYTVAIAPSTLTNTNTVGGWDGFANGFSTDQRVFKITQAVTISQKSVGSVSAPWSLNDAFTVSLPNGSTAVITDLSVVALVSNQQTGTKTPVNLLSGQISISGLGSRSATVTFSKNLSNTQFDPGSNPLYVTLAVQYPSHSQLANSGLDLRKIPISISGGYVDDKGGGKILPLYGVSEYIPATEQTPLQAFNFLAINPKYSNVLFGCRIWLKVAGSTGVQATIGGTTTTTFTIPRLALNSNVNGWYCTRCWDFDSGAYKTISSRVITTSGTDYCIITLQEQIDPASSLIFSFIAQDTCQVAYNAPVKGITALEETVLIGNYTSNNKFKMDTRVSLVSVNYDPVAGTNTVVLAPNNAVIKGIAGDDVNQFVWVQDGTGNFTPTLLSSVSFNNGVITAVCPSSVNLLTQKFFFVASLLPALTPASTTVIEMRYVPYQGEGLAGRNYEILYNEESALVTTNGTGAAPIVGLKDVYPYNRELPIVTSLPAQVSWDDSELANIPLNTLFDDNYSSMQMANVEDTFLVPMHANDFIPPVNRDIPKTIQFVGSNAGNRGFATATPHIGFAIKPPTPKTVLGQNLQATTAPIVIYVDNLSGSDNNSGLAKSAAMKTIGAAIAKFPPVLRHPCSIQLVQTGLNYQLATLSSSLVTIPLGDGNIISTKWYALANASFVIQASGRFVITAEATATSPVVIDATGFTGFGDGPTSAFFVDQSRVIFNFIKFVGFTDPAIKGIDSDIEFVDCTFQDNVTAGSFEQGCGVVLSDSIIQMGNGMVGFVLSGSQMTVANPTLIIESGTVPGPFFVAERQSNMTLQTHGITSVEETNITSTNVIADAEISSSIVCAVDWQSNGAATLKANSALSRTVSTNPFLGGVTADSSSSVVTNV